MKFNARGLLGIPRYSSIGPFASRKAREINLELDGRHIESITTNDSRLEFEVINKEIDNQFTGTTIYATLTDGSEISASMQIDPYQGRNVSETGNRAHLFHLKVPKKMRGKGIGSTLMQVYKEYVAFGGFVRISGRIGNGGTLEFMEENGIDRDVLHKVNVPSEIDKSVVIGTKEDAQAVEGLPPAEAAQAMRGVPLDVAFKMIER